MSVRIGAAMIVLAMTMLVVGSSGVSSVTLERSVDVRVVDDSDAMVGVDARDRTVSNGTSEGVELVDVQNRAGASLSVTVESDDAAIENLWTSDGGSIEAGEEGTIIATVSCNDDEQRSIPIELTARSDTTVVELTREATISCESGA